MATGRLLLGYLVPSGTAVAWLLGTRCQLRPSVRPCVRCCSLPPRWHEVRCSKHHAHLLVWPLPTVPTGSVSCLVPSGTTAAWLLGTRCQLRPCGGVACHGCSTVARGSRRHHAQLLEWPLPTVPTGSVSCLVPSGTTAAWLPVLGTRYQLRPCVVVVVVVQYGGTGSEVRGHR